MRARRYTRHDIHDRDEAELDLTPMLDVVFIMLIFFIVTTSFVHESGIEINRPSAATATRQSNSAILVAIRKSGEVWIDGRPMAVNAIGPTVQRLRAQSPQAGVVVQSDLGAPVGRLVEVMDQIRLFGIRDIAIATEGAPGP
ncbi:MAG: biopolymer transporter ExbD [Pseudomonadota bacterium]